jgi:hypothetical protein
MVALHRTRADQAPTGRTAIGDGSHLDGERRIARPRDLGRLAPAVHEPRDAAIAFYSKQRQLLEATASPEEGNPRILSQLVQLRLERLEPTPLERCVDLDRRRRQRVARAGASVERPKRRSGPPRLRLRRRRNPDE